MSPSGVKILVQYNPEAGGALCCTLSASSTQMDAAVSPLSYLIWGVMASPPGCYILIPGMCEQIMSLG